MSSASRMFQIAGRRIGPSEPCYVIAEVGLNHNGDLGIARQLVDAAVAAGADAVKFQKRKLRETYQEAIIDQPLLGEQGLQYVVPLLIEFELSDDDFRGLLDYCRLRNITGLCTPWDRASVDFLNTCDLAAYKIGSPDMTNFPLIEHAASVGLPLLISTGMATEEEIRRTLAHLDGAGADYGVFHCVSTYPAAAEEINLRFMDRLREWSGRPVGYSGHEEGISISLAAVARGASMLERHLTLDRGMRGPDHKASLDPLQFAEQVRTVREVEASLGTPHRWITRGETLNRRVLGKSLVAAVDIPARTTITRAMVTSKSPGLGLSPQLLDTLIGRALDRSVARDGMFFQSDIARPFTRSVNERLDVGAPWGTVARFLDVDGLLEEFLPLGMRFVEFHVSDRDLDAGADAYRSGQKPFGFVLHAPEYCHDTLIDLCSRDESQLTLSVRRIQKTVDLARTLASQFTWDPLLFPHGPKVVIHVGGMSTKPSGYDHAEAESRLLRALETLDTQDVELLVENLPPFPWFFGGRWFGHVLCDSASTLRVCRESGLGLCFDTSHASLQCEASGEDLAGFAAAVEPYVEHLHLSDAAGTSGEGLQIGDGTINFVSLLPPLMARQPTVIPEIWMGHHENGSGFKIGLQRLAEIHWASVALTKSGDPSSRPELRSLTVAADSTIFTALRVIDENRLGIAFVVGSGGRVVGVVTDGDIRHALVSGVGLGDHVDRAMTRSFEYGTREMSREELRRRLPGRTKVLPVVDGEGRLVDFVSPSTLEGNS